MHLRGYGSGALWARVLRTVTPHDDAACGATRYLTLTDPARHTLARQTWAIEDYHRGLKPCTGVEKAQVRAARAQIAHISFALRAFLRREACRLRTGIRGYEAKASMVREAVRRYLANPFYTLPATA